MNIHLKSNLGKCIDDEVQAGRYESVADAINAAVAHLQTEQNYDRLAIDKLRAEVDVGLAEADRGDFVEFTAEDVIAELRAAWNSVHSKGL